MLFVTHKGSDFIVVSLDDFRIVAEHSSSFRSSVHKLCITAMVSSFFSTIKRKNWFG